MHCKGDVNMANAALLSVPGRASRPLRTGREFVIVLAADPRAICARWDKAFYAPGEACELTVVGRRLSDVRIDVEAESEDGAWQPIATLEAEVGDGGETARARWELPAPDPHEAGQLRRASWDRAEANPGETLRLEVQGTRLDGAGATFFVEREDAAGSWSEVARWQGRFEGECARGEYRIPEVELEAAPPGALVFARFEDAAMKCSETAWMLCSARGLEGEEATFVLEAQAADGVWVEVGEAISTVRSGQVRAGIPLLSGACGGAQ
jgi:hypothetical protein